MSATPPYAVRLGADENGLGARLGPLIVTAVTARISDGAAGLFARKLRGKLAKDLDDSKRLVAHGNVALGEAWARALTGVDSTPQDLIAKISLESSSELTSLCPKSVQAQCWRSEEVFHADPALVARMRGHLQTLSQRGLSDLSVQSSILCTRRLNEDKASGGNRFLSDLHAMERLILAAREQRQESLLAVCGKVGGMMDYSRFFGPLSLRLHSVLEAKPARSAYHFSGLGEVRFVRDADATDPLVMLASLVGKYLREVLMQRIWRHYGPGEEDREPSGYHDPITAQFVTQSAEERRRRRVPLACFERAKDSP